MPPMIDAIEEHFVAAGRTPKGRKARRAIFIAAQDLIVRRGIEATSLEAVANGAGLTQPALRHHFATRDELLSEFFVATSQWFQAHVAGLVTAGNTSAREQLEHAVAWHLEYMEDVDTAAWLEASAYWLRHAHPHHGRDEFYRWLLGQYARLISEMRPSLGVLECRRKAYALLTLVLGAWTTHGRGSIIGGVAGVVEQRQLLVDAAMELVTS